MIGDKSAFDRVMSELNRQGYYCSFACTFGDTMPDEVGINGKESGWGKRRKLKAWCAKNGISDYRIVRNTSYLKDLHGPAVYELWEKR